MLIIGRRVGLGNIFHAGLALAACIAVFHYTLIRSHDRADCFRAFLHNNWLGGAVFAAVVLDYAAR